MSIRSLKVAQFFSLTHSFKCFLINTNILAKKQKPLDSLVIILLIFLSLKTVYVT